MSVLPYPNHLKGLIDAALGELDWRPTYSGDSEFRTRLLAQFNSAMVDVFEDVPFAFDQTDYLIITEPDVVSVEAVATDRLQIKDSARLVLYRASSALAAGGVAWVFGEDWGGRTIILTDANGNNYYRTVHHTWQNGLGPGQEDRLTIDHPLPLSAAAGVFKYRVITEHYPLPCQAVNIKSAAIVEPVGIPLVVATQQEFEESGYYEYRHQYFGQPGVIVKGNSHQLPAPLYTPPVSLSPGAAIPTDVWVTTDDPAGTFDYVWTMCFGKVDDDQTSRLGHRAPRYESSASPVSASIATTEGAAAIVVTLPNIDRQYGYGPDGTERDGHSGYYIRVYARRRNTETGAAIHRVETPNKFFLAGEAPGARGEFVHDGTPALDRTVPLRNRGVYQQIRMFPRPDAAYKVYLKCHHIPDQVVNDYDSIQLPDGPTRLLVLKFQERVLSGMLNDPERKISVIGEYLDRLKTIRGNYGLHEATKLKKKPATIHPQAPRASVFARLV